MIQNHIVVEEQRCCCCCHSLGQNFLQAQLPAAHRQRGVLGQVAEPDQG